MSDFYQQFLTDRSFQILTGLKKRFRFILIGGWAVYFYTQALKSKDIDIVVDFGQLGRLKKEFILEKNERLKKYQIKVEAIDIDVYLPHYSDLGFPVEAIAKKTASINGFTLPRKEVLLLTKLTAFASRRQSVKGQKDLIDVLSLVLLDDFDFAYFGRLVKQYRLGSLKENLLQILNQIREVEELSLNRHRFAKIRKELLAKFA